MDFAIIVLCTTSSPCLSVCLSVWVQDLSKSCRWMKFGGQFGFVTRTKCLDSGEDPNLDLDMSYLIF